MYLTSIHLTKTFRWTPHLRAWATALPLDVRGCAAARRGPDGWDGNRWPIEIPIDLFPDHPWCWYIDLHNWVIYGVDLLKNRFLDSQWKTEITLVITYWSLVITYWSLVITYWSIELIGKNWHNYLEILECMPMAVSVEVPTVYGGPIFQAYVRGYTSKIWPEKWY